MYKEKKGFELPPHKTKIWRYMSLDKFIFLISEAQLYLPRITSLTDEFEGKLHLWEFFGLAPSKKEAIEKELRYYYINCWNIYDYESNLLRDSYVGKNTLGVAIQSTVGKLMESIKEDQEYYLGKVKYKLPDKLNAFSIATRKLPEYRFEQELRLIKIIPNANDSTEKYEFSINLHKLIDKVYYYPNNSFTQSVFQNLLGWFEESQRLKPLMQFLSRKTNEDAIPGIKEEYQKFLEGYMHSNADIWPRSELGNSGILKDRLMTSQIFER